MKFGNENTFRKLFFSLVSRKTCVQGLQAGWNYARMFSLRSYRKVPKFSDTRKLCCNLPKIQTKRQNLLIFWLKDANGIANSEDPDQTAPIGAV